MRKDEFVGMILSLVIAYLLASLLTQGFAALSPFRYAGLPIIIVKPDALFHNLGSSISNILWNIRGLDVIGQALLLFSAAIGVIVLLKRKEG